MNIHDDHHVDKWEQIIRLVCGAFLGLVVALVFMLRAGPFHPFMATLIVLGTALGCALGALYGGDRFWYLVFRRR
ncbi:hypothetical protein [Massilia sp. CF038]|uniref:hypothetical protein n=1 Tax=Massilia sp. CF038 TaxID=1881045 RepID=UPI0009113731|nr:hypothetical protein [Massilia sp. CF038]SHG60147.1 hypothetical protein SAMN05428948_1230 [Massilia sp. CF038]